MTPTFIALLAAAAVGYAAYQLMPVPDAIWRRRVALALDDSTDAYLPFWRAMLQPVAGLVHRFAPARFLFEAKSQLYWAGREGEWLGWTEAEVWALRLVGGTLGLMLSFLLNSDSALIWALPAAIGFLYPAVRLSGVARRAERRFARELPDAVHILSLLVATGQSLSQAMRRLSEGQGMVAAWFRDTLAAATGESLFTPVVGIGQYQPESGVLRARALESGLPALIGLAVQLDLIHQKGTGAEALLGRLSQQVAADYLGGVKKRAGELEGQLTVPIMALYFMPYVVALVIPMILPMLGGF
ncbi:MAG: hypothetical protein H8E35_10585 [Ardenticatenia bacterium]|nr:hypothetical protein [Ardenticatenia bacterium]